MGVVGCCHLGRRRKKGLNWADIGEVTVKNHWQEPAVFSLALPLLSAAAKWKVLKASKRSLKQERSSKQVKRRLSEQKLNLCAKESDKRIVTEGRRQKRRGLCKRLLGRFVCYRSWFVCLFVVWRRFKDKKRRTEL